MATSTTHIKNYPASLLSSGGILSGSGSLLSGSGGLLSSTGPAVSELKLWGQSGQPAFLAAEAFLVAAAFLAALAQRPGGGYKGRRAAERSSVNSSSSPWQHVQHTAYKNYPASLLSSSGLLSVGHGLLSSTGPVVQGQSGQPAFLAAAAFLTALARRPDGGYKGRRAAEWSSVNSWSSLWQHVQHTAYKNYPASLLSSSKQIPATSRLNLANGLIISRVQYVAALWGGTYRKHIRKIQAAVNWVGRWVTNSTRRTKTNELMKCCNWLKVEEMVELYTLTTMWNVIRKGTPKQLRDKLTIENYMKVRTKKPRLMISQLGFLWRAKTN